MRGVRPDRESRRSLPPPGPARSQRSLRRRGNRRDRDRSGTRTTLAFVLDLSAGRNPQSARRGYVPSAGVRHLLRCDRGTQPERRRYGLSRVRADHRAVAAPGDCESVSGCVAALSGSPVSSRAGARRTTRRRSHSLGRAEARSGKPVPVDAPSPRNSPGGSYGNPGGAEGREVAGARRAPASGSPCEARPSLPELERDDPITLDFQRSAPSTNCPSGAF